MDFEFRVRGWGLRVRVQGFGIQVRGAGLGGRPPQRRLPSTGACEEQPEPHLGEEAKAPIYYT